MTQEDATVTLDSAKTMIREYEEPRAVCAHASGIERVEVTQPQGTKYEWWRCLVCHCEFRPTGQVRPGDGPGELR